MAAALANGGSVPIRIAMTSNSVSFLDLFRPASLSSSSCVFGVWMTAVLVLLPFLFFGFEMRLAA